MNSFSAVKVVNVVSNSHRRVNFDILFSNVGTRRLESFDEGMEFGFRNLNYGREWIPLTFYSFLANRDDDIKLGSELMSHNHTSGFVTIRGHSVYYSLVRNHSVQLKICGSEIMQSNTSLSFRWLQTTVTNRVSYSDPVYLDNVMISMVSSPKEHALLKDDFNSETIIK